MRLLIIASALFLAMIGPNAFAALSDDAIAGVWRTESGGYVQIYRDGATYAGQIVGSSDGKPRYDQNNPDAAKRDRRLLGLRILYGLNYQGDGEYADGRIYDPDSGKTYKAKAKLKGPDTLDARGYIGFSLLGKTQTWHRIDPTSEAIHQDLLEGSIEAIASPAD